MSFTGVGLTHSELTETLHETTLVKPQNSSSGNRSYRSSLLKDPGQVDTLVTGERFHPVQEVKNTTASLNRPSDFQSQCAGKTREQDKSLENSNIHLSHVGLGNNVASGTSLSVERKAECLDLQSLVKDLETRNQTLSEENEKLLKKLSVQSKVYSTQYSFMIFYFLTMHVLDYRLSVLNFIIITNVPL